MYGSGSLVRPPQGIGRCHPRAPAGAARARGADRGRTLGDHPAGAAARVHAPGQAEGSRPGARPPRRRVGLLPLRRSQPRPRAARAVAAPARRQRRPAAAPGRRARAGGAGHARAPTRTGPTRVAGDMERHYSPGRTWEALARAALPLLETGDVLDIASGDGVLAELLAPHAQRYVCVDTSAARGRGRAASACAASATSKCAKATCMPCPSTTTVSTWWC